VVDKEKLSIALTDEQWNWVWSQVQKCRMERRAHAN
jgi:hypothetical protein